MTRSSTDNEFLVKVEDAWYAETKGDLALVADPADPTYHDASLAAVVTSLAVYARENIELVAAAQIGRYGTDIDTVDDAELACRIAQALDLVLYGHRPATAQPVGFDPSVCPTCGEQAMRLVSDVDGDVAYVCADHGATTATTVYYVDDLQAAEPEALPDSPDANGVEWTVLPGLDTMGLPRVMVAGPTRESVIAFVREHWSDDDAEWFQTYIVDRVRSGEV